MFRKYFEKEEEEEKNEQIEDEDINESHENPDTTSVRRKYAKTSEKNINYAGIMKQVHDEDKKWLAEHGENGDEVVTITKETIIEKGGDKDASNIEETKIVKKSSGNLDDKDATSSEIVSKARKKTIRQEATKSIPPNGTLDSITATPGKQVARIKTF